LHVAFDNQERFGVGLMDSGEVAAALGCTIRTVRKLAGSRHLAYVKVGSLTRFRPEDVRAYVSARRVPATDAARQAQVLVADIDSGVQSTDR
jgi:excisionase family DNA binding protein